MPTGLTLVWVGLLILVWVGVVAGVWALVSAAGEYPSDASKTPAND